MDYIYILYFIMLGIFFSYITYIWSTYDTQRSISDSYYRLPKRLQPLFTLFCWGFAIPTIIIGVSIVDSALIFLAGSGIAFVGAAAAFKKKLTKTVHMVGAYGGVIFSQLSVWIDYKMWYVTVAFIGIAGVLQLINLFNKKFKTFIWWQEILAFISICLVFGLKIFG